MRVLLATYSGSGHTMPLRHLRARLRDAGHDVTIASADDVPGGRRYVTVPGPPSGPFEANIPFHAEVLFGEALAREIADIAASTGADVVVADALVPAALAGAHAAGAQAVALLNLPYARLRTELLGGGGWWGMQLGVLNETRRALGLEPFGSPVESWETADRMIVMGIRSLEEPAVELPAHLRFVGPCLPPVARASGDHVIVSLSSSDMGHADALQEVITSLASIDEPVVATTAGVIDARAVRAPDNVRVVDWLDMPGALADAAAIVTHAGHGTVMAALAAGIPIVAVPLGRDQPFTAARLDELGAAVVATTATVADGVRRVLGDPSYRDAAGRLRDEIASHADAAAAVFAELALGSVQDVSSRLRS